LQLIFGSLSFTVFKGESIIFPGSEVVHDTRPFTKPLNMFNNQWSQYGVFSKMEDGPGGRCNPSLSWRLL
jgi:hypothetical protein